MIHVSVGVHVILCKDYNLNVPHWTTAGLQFSTPYISIDHSYTFVVLIVNVVALLGWRFVQYYIPLVQSVIVLVQWYDSDVPHHVIYETKRPFRVIWIPNLDSDSDEYYSDSTQSS